MTQEEKDKKLLDLNFEQLSLKAIMLESDTKASKCIKLGLNFKKTYPNEFTAYSNARTKYNENEVLIAEIEAIVPEEEIKPIEEEL